MMCEQDDPCGCVQPLVDLMSTKVDQQPTLVTLSEEDLHEGICVPCEFGDGLLLLLLWLPVGEEGRVSVDVGLGQHGDPARAGVGGGVPHSLLLLLLHQGH